MAITACDLAENAHAQIRNAQGEVDLRAAISRSYYSAFHSLLPLAELLPRSAKAKGNDVSHFELTERLVEWNVKDCCPALAPYRDIKARVQRAMDAARAKRIVADYRLGADITIDDAKGQVARVEIIRRATATLLGAAEGKGDDGEKRTGTQ